MHEKKGSAGRRRSHLGPGSPLLPLAHCAGTFLTRNLIPATLGNIVGGTLFVGAGYSCSFGTPAHASE